MNNKRFESCLFNWFFHQRHEFRTVFNPFDVIEDPNVTSIDNLPPNLRLAFRRILKKDEKTQRKGLEDLAQWLSTCNEKEFITIQSHFVNIFISGMLDDELDVRERTAAALKSLVMNPLQEKWLAPCIKEMIFTWLGAFYDIGTAGADIQSALGTCFGRDKFSAIGKNTGKLIFERAQEILRDPSTSDHMAIAHAYNAVRFILENSPWQAMQDLNPQWASFHLKVNSIGKLPITTRTAYYYFLEVCQSLKIAETAKWLDFNLFKVMLQDLTCLIPKSTRQTIFRLLLVFQWTEQVRLCFRDFLMSSLNILSSDEIMLLMQLIPLTHDGCLLSGVWNFLELGKPLVDPTKFATIWQVLLAILKSNPNDDSISNIISKALNSERLLPTRLVAEIVPKLQELNPIAFAEALSLVSSERSLEILPHVSADTTVLVGALDRLSLENRTDLLLQILALPKIDASKCNIVIELLRHAGQDWMSCVERILLSSDKFEDASLALILEYLSSQLEDLPLEPKTRLASMLLDYPEFSKIYKVSPEMAIFSLKDPKFHRAFLHFFDLSLSRMLTCDELSALYTLGTSAIKNDCKDAGFAFKYFCSLLSGDSSLRINEKEMSLLSEKLFEIEPLEEHIDTIERLVGCLVEISSMPSILYNAFMLRHAPSLLLEELKAFSKNSIAIWHFPLLLSPEHSYSMCKSWANQPRLSLVRLLAVILSHFPAEEKVDEKVMALTFMECLKVESSYREEPLNLPTIPEIPLKCDLYHMISYGGTSLLLFKKQSISLSRLLEDTTPLEALILDVEDDLEDLPTELSRTQLFKLMAVATKLPVWGKGKYFQLFCNLPVGWEVWDHQTDLREIFIIASFCRDALYRCRITNKEFWANCPALADSLQSKLSKYLNQPKTFIKWIDPIFQCMAGMLKASIFAISSEVLWKGLYSIASLPHVEAFKKPVENICKSFESINCILDNPALDDQIMAETLFSTKWPVVKWTLRSFLMRRVDFILERVRISASTDSSMTCPVEMMIPFRIVREILKQPGKFTLIDALMAMDLFLSLAEGCREDQVVFTCFADYFHEELCSQYLPLLTSTLGWLSDDEKPIPLDCMEFTVIPLGSSLDTEEQVLILAANTLFRLLKTFPGVVRGWFGRQGRVESVLLLRNCTNYMSPLLIERELTRLRKSTLDPLKIRILQSSTSLSVQIDYRLEEFVLSFALSIPPGFPLQAVTVDGAGGDRLGISETRWRSWLLSVQSLLSRNLSVLDAIRQWKANAERVLQGVEPCSVCYCVLQPGDKSLPGPNCKICRNKFHSVCLYRWFKTSGQSTCPMCRSLF